MKKYCELNEKYEKLEKKYEKIMTIVGPMIEEEEEKKIKFQWENNDNFELSNNNKRLKKIKNRGWNSNVKGNKILRKNAINIFKIRVNNINSDKTGLLFEIEKASANSTKPSYEEWNMSCFNTSLYKYQNFKKEKINKGDIVTFIVDLNKGSLSVKKNDISLGVLYDIPKNEDLVPSVLIFYEGDEIEIID